MRTITRITVCLIALLWIWSGILKLLAPDAFRAVIVSHGVLPSSLVGPASRGVPFVEVCLGLAFAWFYGRRTPTIRLLMASLALVSVFSAYLAAVPAQIIAETGCGCQAGRGLSRSLSDSVGIGARASAMWFNAALAAIHVVLILAIRKQGRPAAEHPTPA